MGARKPNKITEDTPPTVSGSSVGATAMMIPVSDKNSISPPSKTSISARQPSSSGNSDDVTATPEPAAHVSLAEVNVEVVVRPPRLPAVGAGVRMEDGSGVVVGGVGVGPSHPQSTPKVVDVAEPSEPSGKIPAAVTFCVEVKNTFYLKAGRRKGGWEEL